MVVVGESRAAARSTGPWLADWQAHESGARVWAAVTSALRTQRSRALVGLAPGGGEKRHDRLLDDCARALIGIDAVPLQLPDDLDGQYHRELPRLLPVALGQVRPLERFHACNGRLRRAWRFAGCRVLLELARNPVATGLGTFGEIVEPGLGVGRRYRCEPPKPRAKVRR